MLGVFLFVLTMEENVCTFESNHPPDKTCATCIYYSYCDREDSFGPVRDEYCDKGHYGHVGYYSEPCKEFKEE